MKMDQEREEGEVRKEDFEPRTDVDEQHKDAGNGYMREAPSKLAKKKWPPRRDIRTLNYAFGEPRVDEAAKETQEWLDHLSIAEEEERNPVRKIFPPGPKYRSGSANQSPQMFERLQRCQENQESYDPPKNRIMSSEKNSSPDIHAGLHEEDNCNRPHNVWKGRRSAAGNNSSSVYAILHPQAELGCKRKKKPKVRRNHLREHLAAIAEMSSLTHMYKEKEKEEEAKRVRATKHSNSNSKGFTKKTVKRSPKKVTNFLEKNMETITQQSAHVRAFKEEPPLPDVLSPCKENIGRVPEYLHRIKTELAQEAERRAIEKAAKSYPPGRRLMSEMNRLHILQKLEEKHKELILILKSFPLIFDTPRQVQLRSNIEKQLRNIEASYSYYDNPKVYISCLDPDCTTCSGQRLDSHFFQQSLTRVPNSHSEDLWDHVAYAAGIQRSPVRRSVNFESGGNKIDDRRASLTKKRRNQEGDIYISPSKRQNRSPQKLLRQGCVMSSPRGFGRSVPAAV